MPENAQDKEPRPLGGMAPFEDWDFHCLDTGQARSREYDERRLMTRRKLSAIAKAAIAGFPDSSPKLESRTSLHNPHAFNGMQVRRLWAYICRGKQEKSRLRKVLGRDLAKDLNAAYKNAYLCVGIESGALEVSLRIHPDGWYDGQNFVKRVKKEGVHGWREQLNALDGYFLRLADWKGEWRCGSLTPEQLEEFLRFYTPGEHALAVERRWPATKDVRAGLLGDGVPEAMAEEVRRLLPLYRFCAWSEESDHLFGG